MSRRKRGSGKRDPRGEGSASGGEANAGSKATAAGDALGGLGEFGLGARWDGIIAIGTAFVASMSLMALEVSAGRLTSSHFGASLYTWTSVIGVVLSGLSLGNYVGGRLADRGAARQTLSLLLILSSIAGVACLWMEHRIFEWSFLWERSWRERIVIHVTGLFFPSSVLLGMVAPVAAKLALSSRPRRGRTLGDLYAWSTVGSIVGTFLAGFYLVGSIGPNGLVWCIVAVLACAGTALARARRVPVAWSVVAAGLIVVGTGPWDWARSAGEVLSLRWRQYDYVLFDRQSDYSHVRVVELEDQPGLRHMYLDKLLHSQTVLAEPDNLLYEYEQIYAVLTHRFSAGKARLTSLTIGGGGYVFPGYLLRHWPGSRTEVLEIDPVVTEAARAGFDLPDDPDLRIYHGDARNYVESLIGKKEAGEAVPAYDFVYGDAFNDIALPYHLTTVEFVGKVRSVLREDGLYLVNLIDNFRPGNFLAAMIETMDEVFEYVYLISSVSDVRQVGRTHRATFVLVGSRRTLDLTDLRGPRWIEGGKTACWNVPADTLRELRRRHERLVLTDDYAPVEQLVDHLMVTQTSPMYLRYYNKGVQLAQAGDVNGAMHQYRKALQANPWDGKSLNNLAILLMTAKRWAEAIALYERAIYMYARNPQFLCNYGIALASGGRLGEAIEQYRRAIAIEASYRDAYYNLGLAWVTRKDYAQAAATWRKGLEQDPEDMESISNLARLLATCPDDSVRDGKEAVALAGKAVELTNRSDAHVLDVLGVSLAEVGRFDEALKVTREAIGLATSEGDEHLLSQLQAHLMSYEQGKPDRIE